MFLDKRYRFSILALFFFSSSSLLHSNTHSPNLLPVGVVVAAAGLLEQVGLIFGGEGERRVPLLEGEALEPALNITVHLPARGVERMFG